MYCAFKYHITIIIFFKEKNLIIFPLLFRVLCLVSLVPSFYHCSFNTINVYDCKPFALSSPTLSIFFLFARFVLRGIYWSKLNISFFFLFRNSFVDKRLRLLDY